MGEWLVELRGHVFDLRDLADLFTTPDLLVVQEGEEFRLKSTAFDALASEDDVYAKAKALMPSLNGIASVYVTGYRNVGISGGIISIDAGGTRKRYIYEAVTEEIRLKASVDVAGGVAVARGPTEADAAIKAALNKEKEVVSRALQFFSLEKNWVNLYKVLDAIEEDMGSADPVTKKGWVSASEIDRFTGTANNHNAAKGNARHGYVSKRPMKKKPMTLAEAEQLIRTLLTQWFKSTK